MFKEFKEFAFKGNLMDMAVGIIIGGAFGTVVKSLVDDVVMPIVGLMTGSIDYSDKFAILKRAEGVADDAKYSTIEAAKEAGNTVMAYGSFVTALISFLIVAFVLFLIIKKFVAVLEEKVSGPEEPEEEKPAEISEDIKLLTEIRDLLKEAK